ncbi:unnamed protein product [Paramecium pentaurelia]|uniref:WD40-repeat-containing domain n=1 Tax=Paramecium pentaurelia TaxID=43138 RepID=A0A8S1Y685_9CILI|nr:unnamed protein product [Paramecium pentaurelia]
MQIRCTQADHQNEQIIGFCIDSKCPNQRPYCHFCLQSHSQHLNNVTNFGLLSEWIKQRTLNIQNVQKNIQDSKIAFDCLIKLFLPYDNLNNQYLQELGISQIDQLIKGLCQMEECEERLFKQLNQSIEQTKSIIDEILKKIKNQTNIKQTDNQEIPPSKISEQIQQIPKKKLITKPNLNPFTFDLMKQNSIKQDEQCLAIAINQDNSVVVAGCNKDIKVFQLQQEKLNQIQFLSEHTGEVKTLNFMKNTNNFVSGSSDSLIIIWQLIGNNQWQCQQKLIGHQQSIQCLLLNNTDDLIISGSFDKTIKFWMKQDKWLCQQTINNHTCQVYSLSINEQQNKVISCSFDQKILVIEQQQLDKKWDVVQTINSLGFRLCFISDNYFTFQSICKDFMHVYEMNRFAKEYLKNKEIHVKCGSMDDCCLFPQQYLKSKCLLVNKNGKNVNLMRNKGNGDFSTQQSIDFGTQMIYGQLSDDCEYLITWDDKSKEIQIRKCREL